jgi:hypothetical protein
MNAPRLSPGILCAPHLAAGIARATLSAMRRLSASIQKLGEMTMRKVAVLLGIAAIAMAPSVSLAKSYGDKATAKPKHHYAAKAKPKHHYAMKHHKHYAAKKPAVTASADPNANTYKLFGNAFK